MPPKKTMKKVIQKTTLKPTTPAKDISKKTATKASEIDDIFSTGAITVSSSKSPKAASSSRKSTGSKGSIQDKPGKAKDTTVTKSKGDKKTKKVAEVEKSDSEVEEDFTPLGESLDDGPSDEDDEDEEEVDAELMFDEEEQNESEEAAIAKLLAKKKSKSTGKCQNEGSSKAAATATTTKVTTKAKGGPKVEAVVFNERPAAAAAAAAAAKIQKFKRVREDGPDSDDELEKKGKRRTDDGLRLFDIHDLNIGKGGDTEKCPFECECCY